MANEHQGESLLSAAIGYRDRGWCPVPVRFQSKAGISGWLQFDPTDDAVLHHFGNGRTNIGVLLGERSRGLVDIDLDCPEARQLAPIFLPATDVRFGREGARGSHFFYRCLGAVNTARYSDPVSSNMLV